MVSVIFLSCYGTQPYFAHVLWPFNLRGTRNGLGYAADQGWSQALQKL